MTTYIYTIIAPPGSLSSSAEGINDLGQVVGEFTDSSGEHGFLYSNGIYTIVVPPGSTGAHLSDINNSGQITGWYGGSGFLDTGGVFTTINPPGSFNTHPLSVNDSGQVVGYYFDSIGEHGFLYSAGTYTTLDLPTGNGYFTVAYDINNSGQIVGYGFGSDAQHGFLYSEGVYTMIDPPVSGSTGTYAIAINASAQIVGFYGDSSNHNHSFLYSGDERQGQCRPQFYRKVNRFGGKRRFVRWRHALCRKRKQDIDRWKRQRLLDCGQQRYSDRWRW